MFNIYYNSIQIFLFVLLESTPLHNAPPKQVQVISAREPISPPANRRTRGAIDPHMLMSMSSGGGESIQKVWQMLDESVTSGDPGSSPPSPRCWM